MSFWTKARTKGEEHQRAVARSSDDWADEVSRLQGDLADEEQRHEQLAEDSGRALLDGSPALQQDLAAAVTRSSERIRALGVAITTAEAREADARRDEHRRAMTVKLRRFYALTATAWRAGLAIREAQAGLREAQRRAGADRDERDRLYTDLVEAAGINLGPAAVDAWTLSNDQLREKADELERLALTATVTHGGGVSLHRAEVIDGGSLPQTDHDRLRDEVAAGQAEQELRREINVTNQMLADAIHTRDRLFQDKTAAKIDRARWAGEVERHTRELAALEAALAEVIAPKGSEVAA